MGICAGVQDIDQFLMLRRLSVTRPVAERRHLMVEVDVVWRKMAEKEADAAKMASRMTNLSNGSPLLDSLSTTQIQNLSFLQHSGSTNSNLWLLETRERSGIAQSL